MANGIKQLQQIQMAKEVTPGTAVTPPTTVWRGNGNMIEDQRVVTMVEESIGVLSETTRSFIGKYMAGLSLNSTNATFEQLQYLLAMACGGPTTGAADGPGTDKIYTTNLPTTALPTTTPYTIVGGDNFETDVMEYALCTKISLSSGSGEALKVGGDLIGRQSQRYATGLAAVAIPAVEDILFQKGKVYLDAIGGTYGTTQVASVIEGIKLDFNFKWVPEFTMDGNLYYTVANLVGWSCTGELMYIHDTPAGGNTGAKSTFRAGTAMLLELKFEGSNVATPGTTYQKRTLKIDLPIVFTKAGALTDKDGISTVAMDFTAGYNPTAGNAGKFIVVPDALATLP